MHAAYARADALALIFGKRWRSTLVARSLLLLLASVVSGLTGALFPKLSMVTIPIQVAVTVLIFIDGRPTRRAIGGAKSGSNTASRGSLAHRAVPRLVWRGAWEGPIRR